MQGYDYYRARKEADQEKRTVKTSQLVSEKR